jgi:hypothetical protein
MDNIYRPPGGDPGDHQPTEQFWPGQGAPPGSQGPGYPGPRQQPPGLQAHLAKDHRRARNWTAGVALAALLAGGGVIAGVWMAGPATLSGSPATSTGSAATGSPGSSATGSSGTGSSGGAGTAGATGQAALLDATLNAADSPDATVTTTEAGAAAPGPGAGAAVTATVARRCARAAAAARAARATGHPVAARRAAGAAAVRCRFLRRRLARFFLLRGVDGQFSFRAADGTIRTLAYERGVIESVNGASSITVRAADGTVWTWALVSKTVVRSTGGKISESSLAAGEPVWVGGPVVSGTKDARLIFVRPPSG